MPRRSGGNRGSSNRRGSSSRSDFGVMDMARERPIAAAAAAAGAAAAGLFLWSRRAQISDQLSNLSDQIGEWTENLTFGEGEEWTSGDDTAGLTTSARTGTRSTSGRGKSTNRTSGRRGMSETGAGNASLGAQTGGGGVGTAPSGRGRARRSPTT